MCQACCSSLVRRSPSHSGAVHLAEGPAVEAEVLPLEQQKVPQPFVAPTRRNPNATFDLTTADRRRNPPLSCEIPDASSPLANASARRPSPARHGLGQGGGGVAPARCERTNKGQVTGFGTTLRGWPASTPTHQSRHTPMYLSPCFGSKWLRRPGISVIGDAGEGPTEARLGADLTTTTPRPLAVSPRLVVLFRGPSRRAWTALVKPGLGDGISTADARGELGV